jgi:hypothetical protein
LGSDFFRVFGIPGKNLAGIEYPYYLAGFSFYHGRKNRIQESPSKVLCEKVSFKVKDWQGSQEILILFSFQVQPLNPITSRYVYQYLLPILKRVYDLEDVSMDFEQFEKEFMEISVPCINCKRINPLGSGCNVCETFKKIQGLMLRNCIERKAQEMSKNV